jgi:transcriptional regulator with XRE-family HTH domain
MELGNMLTHFCKMKNWTIARLARESGVPKATLHGWVTGRSALNLDQLKKVASSLEVTMHELVFGAPDPYERPGEEILKELFTGDVRVSIHRIERKHKRK